MRALKFIWEKFAPLLGGICGCLLAYVAGDMRGNSEAFLTTVATVTVILCGLTGVSLSIMLTTKLDVLKQLKQANFYGDLISMVRVAVINSLLATLVALAGLTDIVTPVHASTYKYVLFFIVMSAVFAFLRLFWLITEAGIQEAEKEMADKWGGGESN